MIRPFIRLFKTVLPKGRQYRKLPVGPAAGCIMAVDFTCDMKAYVGLYEYELLPHFKRMLKPGSNCFDIGGRDGYHALIMARASGAKVASFECEHSAVEQMRRTFAKNPNLSIQVVESYVGAEDGNGLITIDRASHEIFAPDLIKLDVEGAEDMALAGASETLVKHPPCFIIEVHGADKEQKCISMLRSFNYTVRIVDQGWFLKDPARRGYNRWLAAYPNGTSH